MRHTLVLCGALAVIVLGSGCLSELRASRDSATAYRQRMLDAIEETPIVAADEQVEPAPPAATEDAPPLAAPEEASAETPEDTFAGTLEDASMAEPKSLLAKSVMKTPPPPAEEMLSEIPDPIEAAEVFEARYAKLRDEPYGYDQRTIRSYRRVVDQAIEYLKLVERERKVRLSLSECIERALVNNYTIRSESFGPAIERTRLVEAEAAFDAVFFLDSSYARSDDAALVPSGGEQTDIRNIEGGIRQLLPTGMQASVSTGVQRYMLLKQRVTKGTNPVYGSTFHATFTQPLLRGFGLEVNRAQIEVSRANVDGSLWSFEAQVRDRLLAVENAYWQLVQARRNLAILAESVAQNKVTAEDVAIRGGHDASAVQVMNSMARYQLRRVELIESLRIARDAEDALKNLMNDPDFLLSEDVEIVPTETPLAVPVEVDQLAAARTAVESRSEVKEARRMIDALRTSTMYAKNQTMPQLDLTFDYEVQGAGRSADSAFDQVTENDYISYAVGVQFSYPIGNRASRAAHRRARLEESQAIVQLKQVLDGVVQEVNSSVRAIIIRYAQLPPQLESVKASERNLRSLQERAESASPEYLETELSAVEQLASARQVLLQILVEYNSAMTQLERDKGTLLDYNNITLANEPLPE